MSKQKFVVFLIAIIGMIATFLPWYEIGGLGMIMGYQTVGWSTFIMFALGFSFWLAERGKTGYVHGVIIPRIIFFVACRFRGFVADDHASVWTKEGGVCRLPVTRWLTILVFYTGLTKS